MLAESRTDSRFSRRSSAGRHRAIIKKMELPPEFQNPPWPDWSSSEERVEGGQPFRAPDHRTAIYHTERMLCAWNLQKSREIISGNIFKWCLARRVVGALRLTPGTGFRDRLRWRHAPTQQLHPIPHGAGFRFPFRPAESFGALRITLAQVFSAKRLL